MYLRHHIVKIFFPQETFSSMMLLVFYLFFSCIFWISSALLQTVLTFSSFLAEWIKFILFVIQRISTNFSKVWVPAVYTECGPSTEQTAASFLNEWLPTLKNADKYNILNLVILRWPELTNQFIGFFHNLKCQSKCCFFLKYTSEPLHLSLSIRFHCASL